MATEIEHKYLVKNDTFKEMETKSFHIFQGYICREPERTVRVRVRDNMGFLTIKGKNIGASRLEFEYEVPLEDAKEMLTLCVPPILEKIRHIVPFEGHTWEVDEFLGHKSGLITAEIEITSESERYSVPPFIGADITGNPSYYNSNL